MFRSIQRTLLDPRLRYAHAPLIHSGRVAIGIAISLILTYGLAIPNGEWAPISLLIVMVGLQHHGNIRRRALERAFGTAVGAVAGFLVVAQQSYLGLTPLTFTLMAVFCGACAFYAIGRGGYIAQLAAITLVIVAGYGTDPMTVGLWRALNVLIGIVIALALSVTVPIYATTFWRFDFANALRRCAAALEARTRLTREDVIETTIIPQLLKLRTLMPAVARETGLPMVKLDAIQHSLRIFLSLLELPLSSSPPRDGTDDMPGPWQLRDDEAIFLAAASNDLALLLESGPRQGQTTDPRPTLPPDPVTGTQSLAAELLSAELSRLRGHLMGAPSLWTVDSANRG